ncbi:MAG TPA: hypothetical protein VFM18_08430 [Methanosarcina sp.]|nr:hypothetical protein [Methanosarcina sp.]
MNSIRTLIVGAFCASVMLLSGCTDSSTTTRVLEEQGYTNVKTTGYVFFGCPEDDVFHTGFVATSPANKTVSGVVCSGLLFGSVIRFD